jgi:hypothetical protein
MVRQCFGPARIIQLPTKEFSSTTARQGLPSALVPKNGWVRMSGYLLRSEISALSRYRAFSPGTNGLGRIPRLRLPSGRRRTRRVAFWVGHKANRQRVLAAASCPSPRDVETTERSGEKMTLVKHGFESRWGHTRRMSYYLQRSEKRRERAFAAEAHAPRADGLESAGARCQRSPNESHSGSPIWSQCGDVTESLPCWLTPYPPEVSCRRGCDGP